MFDELQAVRRLIKVRDAESDLLAFTELTMPDPRDPGNPDRSEYEIAKHHRFMSSIYERVERGELPLVIMNAPPSHGKSELGTRRFAAWYAGRNPGKHVMIGTYSEGKANDFRQEVLEIIDSDEFRQVFPGIEVTRKESDRLILSTGTRLYFIGRGSAATGRHADLIIIDDPIKDDKEAQSLLIREQLWKWWTKTISTRRRTEKAPVVVTQTRWVEDDLSGRLGDPANPYYSKLRAEDVTIINLPALAEEDDPMGRKPGEPLWPGRFGTKFLELKREEDSTGFAALYQGRPAPEDGIFWTRDIVDPCEYDQGDFPEETERLQWYGASDHAVSTQRMNDFTCMLPFAVDKSGCVWIHHDIKWSKIASDQAVDFMIATMKARRTLGWYSARGTIDNTLGPFIRRRMSEEGTYTPLYGIAETTDKVQRGHSARARAAQKKIRFPRYATWWPRAKEQLLKFPNGAHADFVDTVSLIGLAVDQIVAGTLRDPVRPKAKEGTFAWLLASDTNRVPMHKSRNGW